MPIKAVEQQLDAAGALGNMPRIGKLRKGGVKGDTKPGADLEYFRLTLEPQYEYVRDSFVALYGSEPKEFHNVLLAADTADDAFTYYYETWKHAKLDRRCDGEEIVGRYIEGTGYDATHTVCICDDKNRECHQHGYMDLVFPDLCGITGTWGKITLLTTSIYDVIALRKCMKLADIFAARLPDIAFWSIPFTIGRALQTVPVTINGKRSLKPMHLIYAQVEADFNKQVFTPMLTRPAQLLIAGVNPGTGELPQLEEVVIEQSRGWDFDYVIEQTAHLFDHANHQFNAIAKMRSDGDITDTMMDDEVIDAILENRVQRNAEKNAQNTPESRQNVPNPSAPPQSAPNAPIDTEWTHNAQSVVKFLGWAQVKTGLNHGQVIAALSYTCYDILNSVDQYLDTKESAMAACIAHYCNYDAASVASAVYADNTPIAEGIRSLAIEMIELHNVSF